MQPCLQQMVTQENIFKKPLTDHSSGLITAFSAINGTQHPSVESKKNEL